MKLLLDDGSWILVRESGTEPIARAYVETKSEKELEALAKSAEELLRP
jgi:phosphomannomutase